MADTKFIAGFFFDAPKPGVPDFVKGKLSIKVEEAVAFLQANKNEAGYVNCDLLESKDKTKRYFALNDWKPEPKTADDGFTASEVPF